MIIIIKKDGQIVTDDGNPIEGKTLEGAYMLLADAQDGDSIVYDGTNHMWKAGSGGGSFDPAITDPQDGDTLVYNAAQQKWVNGAGGSGVGYLKVSMNPGTGALDKTWKEIHDAFIAGYYVTIAGYQGDEEGGEGFIFLVCHIGFAVGEGYSVSAVNFENIQSGLLEYFTESENGYPVLQSGE